MSLFSRMMDHHVESHFRKDPSGRLVFLPFGSKKTAYYVDTKPDEEKIRAFVKLYRIAGVLLSWMTFPGIYVPGLLLDSYRIAIPLKTKLEAVAGTSLLFLLLFLALFWMLWGVYKKTVSAFTSSMSEVGPELKGQLSKISEGPLRFRRVALLCLLGVMVLMGGLILATSRYSGEGRRSPGVVCPPTAHGE
jgi:hypothetical protein